MINFYSLKSIIWKKVNKIEQIRVNNFIKNNNFHQKFIYEWAKYINFKKITKLVWNLKKVLKSI